MSGVSPLVRAVLSNPQDTSDRLDVRWSQAAPNRQRANQLCPEFSAAVVACAVERRGYKAGRTQGASEAGGASCPRFAFVGGRSAHAVPAGWQVSHLFVGGYLGCAKNCAVVECEVPAAQIMSLSGRLACRHPVHVNRRYDVPDLWMTNHGHVDALSPWLPMQVNPKIESDRLPSDGHRRWPIDSGP